MNTEGLTRLREYIRKDKPKVPRKDFQFHEPLTHGWMLRYLLPLESMTWQRWDYWATCAENQSLPAEPIPWMVRPLRFLDAPIEASHPDEPEAPKLLPDLKPQLELQLA